MNSRLVKQILYAFGYLSVFFVIAFLTYLIWFKPEPTCFDNRLNQNETEIDCGGICPACEIKTLKAPSVSWIKYFPANDKTIIVAEIKNPNLNYGSDFFSYNMDIYDDTGIKIKNLAKSSFIHAGEIKRLIESVEINHQEIQEIKISFFDIDWKLDEKFKKANTQWREIKTENDFISGFLTNTNAFSLSKARIFGFLYNNYGSLISASKTELEDIPAFEEKFFKVTFPKELTDIDKNRTEIYVEAIR